MENKKLQELLKEKASTYLATHITVGGDKMRYETDVESMSLDSTNQPTTSIPVPHEKEGEEPIGVELSVDTFKPLQLTQYSGAELIKQIRVSYGCEAKVYYFTPVKCT